MTAIAKLLVFLTLVLGVGGGVFATAVYTQRPTWFNDPPDGPVAKGHVVLTFKGLAKDIDTAGKAAGAASGVWGQQRKDLEAAEKDRLDRAKAYADLLTKAKSGAVGFYALKEDTNGRLVLDGTAVAVLGPDNKTPLAGVDTLIAPIARATDRIANDLTPKIQKHQADQKRLGAEIDVFAEKLARQRVIREDLQNEAAYLADAGVNVTEQRGTADRRKAQLADRLKAFQPAPMPMPQPKLN